MKNRHFLVVKNGRPSGGEGLRAFFRRDVREAGPERVPGPAERPLFDVYAA